MKLPVLSLLSLFVVAGCTCGIGKPPPKNPPAQDAGTANAARLAECGAAQTVLVDRELVLTGSRLGAGKEFVGSNYNACSDGAGEDLVYRLDFPRDTEVYMRLDTGGWGIVQLRQDCAAGPDLACGNKTVGLFETSPADFTLHVDAGTYYAILDSEDPGDEGYTLTVTPTWTAEKEAKCAAAEPIVFDAGRWVATGDTTGQSRLFEGSFIPACGDGRAAEKLYALDLNEPVRLSGYISTLSDWGIFDVKPSCFTFSSVGCANEFATIFNGKAAGGFDVLVPDGGHFIVVIDSEFDAGVYTAGLTRTPYTPVAGGDSCANAIVLAGAGRYAGRLEEDGGNTVALSCGSDAGVPDVHFRFALAEKSRVTVNVLGGFTPQTVALYASCGGPELACDDAALSSIELEAGTHELALELGSQPYSRNYWFELDITAVPDGGFPDAGVDAGAACATPCGAGTYCANGTCQSCTANNRCGTACSPCPSTTPYCNGAGNACVACQTSSQCPSLSPCCTTAGVCQTNIVGCQ